VRRVYRAVNRPIGQVNVGVVCGQLEHAKLTGLCFGGGTGEGSGQAEGDQDAAGNVARGLRPARGGLQRTCEGAGEDGPEHVAENAHESKHGAEEENLRGYFSSGRVHELR